ncbi:hypothetical protein PROFUN_05797 [Planoprotostelium fungivorum]|uniref:Amine oxidase n=1 Tax=Planoprotostelium fungivorum TaxID=1890364 RepID=A0A2P6NPY8_9EUKA|nr:hypothetical protein PROFUN_05797 [Planoprotostelium fungivorum]
MERNRLLVVSHILDKSMIESHANQITVLFIGLVLLCIFIRRLQGKDTRASQDDGFRSFQYRYLIVYLLAMGADWLQGPYVYKLYSSYDFSQEEISQLFVGGFLSGAIFGTFVGTLADKYGRKRLTIVFGISYILSCLTKYINHFWVLMLGRILGGISTSLLFSVLEAWMVAEHHKRGFGENLLSLTFSLTSFYNGVVAITAGLAASAVADTFGYVAPFGLSIILLAIMIVLAHSQWSENFGDENVQFWSTFDGAWEAIRKDVRIVLLCLIQSFFEAAMYTFVFMWTPVLTPDASVQIPLGLVFACFMVSLMIGSSVFSIISERHLFTTETVATIMLCVSALTLSVPILFENLYVNLPAFLVFEMCCGVYWPCYGTIRSRMIPESCRSGVMNFARIPLNLIVVFVLTQAGSQSHSTSFMMCLGCLVIAIVLQMKLNQLPPREKTTIPDQTRIILNEMNPALQIFVSILIFILAGIAEIGGGWLVWQTIREKRPWWWALLGSLILVAYGFIPTLQKTSFSRSYAAYGGIFVAMSFLWGYIFDKTVPDRWDLIGGVIVMIGVIFIMFVPRGQGEDDINPQLPVCAVLAFHTNTNSMRSVFVLVALVVCIADGHLYDAIIVGGGLSGLSTARRLHQAGKDNILVLEAQDRVGGRTLDVKTSKGNVLEMGGQWIGPGQDEMFNLSRALGIETFDMYTKGDVTYRWNGQNTRYSGDVPPIGLLAKADLLQARYKLNRVNNVDKERPWNTPSAKEYDENSIGSWIEANMWTLEAKQVVRMALKAVYGEDVGSVSLLDLLSLIASSGGLDAVLDGAQDTRFKQGPQSISIAMAKDLGAIVHLKEKVVCIEESGGSFIVHSDLGRYEAKHVVVTLPRPTISSIQFSPYLPAPLVQLLQRQPMGNVIKMNIVYDTPFWRETGSNGQALLPEENSPFVVTYDNSPPDGSEGIIIGLMIGSRARQLAQLSKEERQLQAVDLLVQLYGPSAGNFTEFHEKVWAEDEFAHGAYGSYNPPGVLFQFQDETRTKTLGNLHFAGEATSEEWSGYMEGAVRSGYRVCITDTDRSLCTKIDSSMTLGIGQRTVTADRSTSHGYHLTARD